VGVYDLEVGVSITFAVDGDGLTGQVGGQSAFPLMYLGLKDGIRGLRRPRWSGD